MMKNKNHIIIAAIVVVSLLILIFVIFNRPIDTGIEVFVAPSDSKVLIDNKRARVGQNATKPGKHTVEVSRDNFYTSKVEVSVREGEVIKTPVGLGPKNTDGEELKKEINDEYLALDGIASEQFNEKSTDITKKYPIVADLPKDISPIFRIDYGVSKRYPNDPSKIAIYISSNTPADKNDALNYIYIMGYDPSDYEIIFERL